jgi:hypothetical protein
VIVPEQQGQPVIEFELPQMQWVCSSPTVRLASGTLKRRMVLAILANIAPGDTQHQVLFVYELPYDRKQPCS